MLITSFKKKKYFLYFVFVQTINLILEMQFKVVLSYFLTAK